tara:strand:+ start:13786 stop:14229 length:444 start_codon:yes stop_codon:yes gene_type:complete
MAAQRVYYRVEVTIPYPDLLAFEVVEITGLPIKGLIRRIRLTDTVEVNQVRFTLSESPFSGSPPVPTGGALDIITKEPSTLGTTPQDIFANELANANGTAAAGNEGIPFELTPYETDYRTGSMWIGYTSNRRTETLTLQLTIESLFP